MMQLQLTLVLFALILVACASLPTCTSSFPPPTILKNIVGGATFDEKPANQQSEVSIKGLALAPDGNVLYSQDQSLKIYDVNAFKVRTWADTSFSTFSIDVRPNGDIYMSASNGNIYKMKKNRSVSTLGNVGYSFFDAFVHRLQRSVYGQIRLGSNGDLTFANPGAHCIKTWVAKSSQIITIAGKCQESGSSNDGTLATNSYLNTPSGIVFSSTGELFIADTGNNKILKILQNGKLITIAGTGTSGVGGEYELATSSKLNAPTYLNINSKDELYFADAGNNRIRKILSNNQIVTVAKNQKNGLFIIAPNDDLFTVDGGYIYRVSNSTGNSTTLVEPLMFSKIKPQSLYHFSVEDSPSFEMVGESIYVVNLDYITKVNITDGTFKYLIKTEDKFTIDQSTGDIYSKSVEIHEGEDFSITEYLYHYNASTGISSVIAGKVLNETIPTKADCVFLRVDSFDVTTANIFIHDFDKIKIIDKATSKIKTIYTMERGSMDQIMSITGSPYNSNNILVLKGNSILELSSTGSASVIAENQFERPQLIYYMNDVFVVDVTVKKFDHNSKTSSSIIYDQFGVLSIANTNSGGKLYLCTFESIVAYTLDQGLYTLVQPASNDKVDFTPGVDLFSMRTTMLAKITIRPDTNELYIADKCAIFKADAQNKVTLVFGEYGKCYWSDNSLLTVTSLQFDGTILYIGSSMGLKKLDVSTKVLTSVTTKINGCLATDLNTNFLDFKFKNNMLYTIVNRFVGTIQKGIFNVVLGPTENCDVFDPVHPCLSEPESLNMVSGGGFIYYNIDRMNGNGFVFYNTTNSFQYKIQNEFSPGIAGVLDKNGAVFYNSMCTLKKVEKKQEELIETTVAGTGKCPNSYLADTSIDILNMDLRVTNVLINDDQIYFKDNDKIRAIVKECPKNSTFDQNSGECVCKDGYSGSLCTEYSCFGKLKTEQGVCSDSGVCVAPNTCACAFNFVGNECNETTCYGLSMSDPSVCSGFRGKCTDFNTCVCIDGYIGKECEIISCYGIGENLPTVCSSHGSCNSPNNCTCSDGYYGNTCNLFDCFGISSKNSSVCSGKGSCTALDTCKCNTNYFGPLCNDFNCYGISVFNQSVCSNHGKCLSYNNCGCGNGWFGNTCELTYCNGVMSNNTSVCSSHGSCISPNNCTCSNGYHGNDCELFECFGISSKNSSVCSGKGSCTALDTCKCNTNYNGTLCDHYDCYGISVFNQSVCSNHGKCLSYNNCSCENGWFGNTCELTYCNGVLNTNSSVCSSRGSCILKDTCSCNEKYYGSNCELFACFGIDSRNLTTCSNHGVCVTTDTCQCEIGWDGNDQCSQFTCTTLDNCNKNGICVSNNTCKCYSGWTERNCSTFSCEHNCYGNGVCISNNTCECISGWIGAECQIATCHNISQYNSSVCSSKGQCLTANNCTCMNGYYGNDCSQFDCFEIPFSNSSTCSSVGTCVDYNNCKCKNGYFHQDCSGFTCYGVHHKNGTVCQSHGNCTGPDQCLCENGYHGDDCSQFECNGIDRNNQSVCYSRGKCSYSNNCDCDEYFYGEWCQFSNISCFGILYSQDNVCSERGVCQTQNLCKCQETFGNAYVSGQNCQHLTCFTNYYGELCENFCQENITCNSHGKCMESNGTCSCNSNDLLGYWTGLNCTSYKDNYYGTKCQTYFNEESVRIDPNGRGMTISTKYPNIMSIQCKDLLKDTSKLGNGAVCSWNGVNIKITFGFNHSIRPGMEIFINVRVFERDSEMRAFQVLPPNSVTPSPIVKVVYKESYAPCESVKLDASQSFISVENTELFFKWTVSPFVNLLNSTISVPLPTIEIVNSDVISGIQTSQVPLQVKQLVKYNGCNTNDKLSNYKIEWVQFEGNSIYSVNNNDLYITSFESLVASQYIFRVNLIYLNRISSAATVTINTIEDDFSIVLYQTDLTSEQTTLHVEIQPLTMLSRLKNVSRIWTCKSPSLNCDLSVIGKLNENPNLESITLLKSSQVDLSLQILNKVSEISIIYPPPKVIIPLINVLSINPPRSTISNTETLNVQLLISVDGQVDNIDSLVDISWTLRGSSEVLSRKSSVSVDGSKLNPGSEYTLDCAVTSLVSNRFSNYSLNFKVANILPKCECSISPSSGYPLETLFTFKCPSTCINSETYLRFGFKDATSGSVIPLSQGKKIEFTTVLPYTGKTNLDVYFSVISLSSKSDFISQVSISLKSLSMVEWKKLTASWITKYKSIANSDPQKIIYSYAQMTSDAMKSNIRYRSLSSVNCLNGGIYNEEYDMCQCQYGFKKSNCEMTLLDWIDFSSMRWDFQSLVFDSIKYELQNDALTDNSLTINLALLSNSISVFDEVLEDMYIECLVVFNSILNKIEASSQLSIASQIDVMTRLLDLVVSTHVSLYGNNSLIHGKVIDYTNKIAYLATNSLVSGMTVVSTKYSSVVSSKHFPTELSNKILTLNNRNERVSFGSGMVKYIQNVNLRKPLISSATTLYSTSPKLNETIIYLSNGNSTLTSRILNYEMNTNFSNQQVIIPINDQVISFTFIVNKSNNSISRQQLGDKILTTRVETFYTCLSNVECSLEDLGDEFKTCKCSLPSFVKLEETINKTITLDNVELVVVDPVIIDPIIIDPIENTSKLEYLGLLALLVIPILIVVIIIIVLKVHPKLKKTNERVENKELMSV